MTDTFRTLCTELVEALRTNDYYDEKSDEMAYSGLLKRACAALAQPEPVGPTDEELHQLWLDLYAFHDGPTSGGVAEIARAVLARWGRSALTPIPVSERLPVAEDCAPWPGEPNATPWAWAAKCVDNEWEWVQLSMLGLGSDALARIIAGGGWTHWLPFHALPLPAMASCG